MTFNPIQIRKVSHSKLLSLSQPMHNHMYVTSTLLSRVFWLHMYRTVLGTSKIIARCEQNTMLIKVQTWQSLKNLWSRTTTNENPFLMYFSFIQNLDSEVSTCDKSRRNECIKKPWKWTPTIMIFYGCVSYL